MEPAGSRSVIPRRPVLQKSIEQDNPIQRSDKRSASAGVYVKGMCTGESSHANSRSYCCLSMLADLLRSALA
jgi:hypothetical protein